MFEKPNFGFAQFFFFLIFTSLFPRLHHHLNFISKPPLVDVGDCDAYCGLYFSPVGIRSGTLVCSNFFWTFQMRNWNESFVLDCGNLMYNCVLICAWLSPSVHVHVPVRVCTCFHVVIFLLVFFFAIFFRQVRVRLAETIKGKGPVARKNGQGKHGPIQSGPTALVIGFFGFDFYYR